MGKSRDKRKWYQKKRWVIGLLLFFPPVGVVLLWITEWPRWAKITGTVLSGIFMLSALASDPSETQVSEPPPSPPLQETVSPSPTPAEPAPSPVASATPSPSPSASSQFEFPQSSCGDSASSGDTWYPVFVDEGDLAEIRNQYCADAINTVRQDTGNPSVQVASFADRSRAQQFAAAIGGEVGQPSTPEAEVEESPSISTPVPPPSPADGSPIRAAVTGSCQCPYDTDSAGRRCGGRSAYSRPGGDAPVCYVGD